MKAVVFDAPGQPDVVLQPGQREVREPGHGEVLVRMLASPVNPSDLMFVRGVYALKPECPATPGFEGVGIVEKSGGGLRGAMMTGKRVAVLSKQGGNWAEMNTVPAAQVIPFSPPLTGDLTLEQAATFFVNPATAYIMATQVLRVPRDAWLLVTAAGSVLGRMVLRLGRRYGFRTLAVVRREEQARELEAGDASAAIRFDPAQDDPAEFIARVLQITHGHGVPFAMDCVGGATGSAVTGCLAHDGRMLVYGTLSGEPLQFSPRALMTPGASIEGFWLGRYMERQSLMSKLSLVRKVAGLIRSGVLHSEIGATFGLDEIAAAVREAERLGHSGKVLLKLADQV